MSPADSNNRERAEDRSGVTYDNRSTERGDPSGVTSGVEKSKKSSFMSTIRSVLEFTALFLSSFSLDTVFLVAPQTRLQDKCQEKS